MELALLSGANPRVSGDGPITRLTAGEWNIEARGVEDSILWVNVGYGPPALHSLNGSITLKLDHGMPVYISWQKRGSEKHVSVVAKSAG